MSVWIDPVSNHITREGDKGEPYFLRDKDLSRLNGLVGDEGMVARIDVAEVSTSASIVATMKAALPFPEWCGSGWDSVYDAIPDLIELWNFPIVLVVDGIDALWTRSPQLLMQTSIRLAELSDILGREKKQVLIVYRSDSDHDQ
ncbi:MAG: barstar family protein [Lacisediminihabitans sp.]